MKSLHRFATCALFAGAVLTAAPNRITEGSLISLDSKGQPQAACPLKHTDVKAEISGFLARVTVTQEFANPFKDKIEAVYTFPLPQNAAVDDMTMLVGSRVVTRQDQAPRGGARDLRGGARRRARRRPAGPGAAQHLHAVGGQHHARRAGEDHHQLRRDAEVRGRHRTSSSSPWWSGRATSPASRSASRAAAGRPTPTRPRRLAHHAAGDASPARAPATTSRSKSRSTRACRSMSLACADSRSH